MAILFAGIFATMMPALDWLQANAARLASPNPALFYWSSGVLSSILDNAPTYLCFLSAAFGLFTKPDDQYILAISIASVFFGANTYIGNGPNFMVKSIADHQKVHMPGFLGYVFKYSLPYMLPMLLLIWLLFFH